MSTLNGMKYLVFRHEDTITERIFLFQAIIQHKDFASMISKEWKAVRGGFVWIYDGVLQCYGESFSLGLQGDPVKDLRLLKRELVKD